MRSCSTCSSPSRTHRSAPQKARLQRPKHVTLLDYEIELALIFKRPISSPVTVTEDTLKDYVFAVAIANDLSARDVQLPQMQFFKGKSYRGFCPIGPWLTVLGPEEFDLPRRTRIATQGQRLPASTRYNEESRVQARRNDFRIVDFRKRHAR